MFEYAVEGVLIVIFGTFGVLGNALLIQLFFKKGVILNFQKLMVALAIYDTLYTLLSIINFSMPELVDAFTYYGYYQFMVPTTIPMMQVALTGSTYCIAGISLERYLTVCHPFFVARTQWSARRYIIPITTLSLLYNVPHFFELRAEEVRSNYGIDEVHNSTTDTWENMPNYHVFLTPLRKNKYYYLIYIIGLNSIINGIIPYASILILNTILYKRLKILANQQSFQSHFSFNEVMLSKVSLINSMVFILFHSVKWIANIYEVIQRITHSDTEKDIEWPSWVEHMTQASHFLITLNSSLHFYIYWGAHHLLPVSMLVECRRQSTAIEMRSNNTAIEMRSNNNHAITI